MLPNKKILESSLLVSYHDYHNSVKCEIISSFLHCSIISPLNQFPINSSEHERRSKKEAVRYSFVYTYHQSRWRMTMNSSAETTFYRAKSEGVHLFVLIVEVVTAGNKEENSSKCKNSCPMVSGIRPSY